MESPPIRNANCSGEEKSELCSRWPCKAEETPQSSQLPCYPATSEYPEGRLLAQKLTPIHGRQRETEGGGRLLRSAGGRFNNEGNLHRVSWVG